MLLIPAIDIKEGRCVSLCQGDLDKNVTVYSADPVEQARQWVDMGAERLHIVDLDAATGHTNNLSLIRDIVQEFRDDVSIQLGGGIRTLDQLESLVDAGIDYCVIGTAAIKRPGFLHDACSNFGGQIIVSLDAKDGKVATNGWQQVSGTDVIELAQKFENYGIEAFLYTDISRDGMLNGCNIEAIENLAKAVNVPIIAQGGVRNLDDVRALLDIEYAGLQGVVLGRSLYEGLLHFDEVLALLDD